MSFLPLNFISKAFREALLECTNGQLTYGKGGKSIPWRKDTVFNKWCWKNWTITCKRVKLEHSLTPPTHKNNSKCLKDLNVKARLYKTLRGKHRQNSLCHKSQQDIF